MPSRGSAGRHSVSHPSRGRSLFFTRHILNQPPNGRKQSADRPLTGSSLLILVAGCLLAGFVGSIMAEAFDSDLDVCPFGAEDCTVAEATSSPAAVQPGLASTLLNQALSIVLLAGACLILLHRPRSGLASDSRLIFSSFNAAASRGSQAESSPAAAISFSLSRDGYLR